MKARCGPPATHYPLNSDTDINPEWDENYLVLSRFLIVAIVSVPVAACNTAGAPKLAADGDLTFRGTRAGAHEPEA